MKIHQLFRANVPNELFIKICASFGYSPSMPEYTFCKVDLERLCTVDRVNEHKDELCQYYIPCKAKLYLTNITLSKCITVFRQILRLNNMVLISFQKYIKHKKTTFYCVKRDRASEEESTNEPHGMKVDNRHLVLSFS